MRFDFDAPEDGDMTPTMHLGKCAMSYKEGDGGFLSIGHCTLEQVNYGHCVSYSCHVSIGHCERLDTRVGRLMVGSAVAKCCVLFECTSLNDSTTCA